MKEEIPEFLSILICKVTSLSHFMEDFVKKTLFSIMPLNKAKITTTRTKQNKKSPEDMGSRQHNQWVMKKEPVTCLLNVSDIPM